LINIKLKISLKDTTKVEDIFSAKNHLYLEILFVTSTYGTPAMIGKEMGVIKLFIDKIKSKNKTLML